MARRREVAPAVDPEGGETGIGLKNTKMQNVFLGSGKNPKSRNFGTCKICILLDYVTLPSPFRFRFVAGNLWISSMKQTRQIRTQMFFQKNEKMKNEKMKNEKMKNERLKKNNFSKLDFSNCC